MVRLLYCNVTWMNQYRGMVKGEAVSGGGSYVDEQGFGHEMFNFRPFEGCCFGYVQPPGQGDYNERRININKLGAKSEEDFIEGVNVVWTARSKPLNETVIVGWYKNATVYRAWQRPPDGSGRYYADEIMGFYVKAAEIDSFLLPVDRRVVVVPRGKGGMGQANIWYAQNKEAKEYNQRIVRYMESQITPKTLLGKQHKNNSVTRQPDTQKRRLVEETAVNTVRAFYENEGYTVESVENENLGWDLDVHLGSLELKVEVKGLSGALASVELTPNEYEKMEMHRDQYRLAIVTNTLTSPELIILLFNKDSGRWEDSSNGSSAIIEPRTGARISICN